MSEDSVTKLAELEDWLDNQPTLALATDASVKEDLDWGDAAWGPPEDVQTRSPNHTTVTSSSSTQEDDEDTQLVASMGAVVVDEPVEEAKLLEAFRKLFQLDPAKSKSELEELASDLQNDPTWGAAIATGIRNELATLVTAS